jgi:hypothetical protein
LNEEIKKLMIALKGRDIIAKGVALGLIALRFTCHR